VVGTCLWDGGLGRSHIAGGSACPKGGQLGSRPVSLIEEFRQVTFLALDRFGGRFRRVPFDGSVVSLHDSALPIRLRLLPSEQPLKEFLIRTKVCLPQSIDRQAEIDNSIIGCIR
jgi:hypothetical protein